MDTTPDQDRYQRYPYPMRFEREGDKYVLKKTYQPDINPDYFTPETRTPISLADMNTHLIAQYTFPLGANTCILTFNGLQRPTTQDFDDLIDFIQLFRSQLRRANEPFFPPQPSPMPPESFDPTNNPLP